MVTAPRYDAFRVFCAPGKRIVLGLKQCILNDPKGPTCNGIPELPLRSGVFGSRIDKVPIQAPVGQLWDSGWLLEDIRRIYDSMIDRLP